MEHDSDDRGFGRRIGWGDRPALLVVDMMCGFTEDQYPLGSDLDDALEHINRLLKEAHGHDVPVLFSTIAYDDPELRDAGLWPLKIAGCASMRRGSRPTQLDPRLDRAPEDAVVPKKYASCFFGTDLVSRLVSQHVDTLVITGCTTSGCVRATAVDALQYGFRPIVPAEAVGDRWPAAHRQSLADMDAKYADVMSVDETAAALAGRPVAG